MEYNIGDNVQVVFIGETFPSCSIVSYSKNRRLEDKWLYTVRDDITGLIIPCVGMGTERFANIITKEIYKKT